MNGLISIVIPVYKVERYLRECLDSVVNQTYRNLEIILVDDGSPDGCPVICCEYAAKDSRVKVIHKGNGGLSDARNKGIDVATGEYITFVDSDDIIHEFYVESLYKALIESGTDVAQCQRQNFEELKDLSKGCVTNDKYTLSGYDAVKDLYMRLCGKRCQKNFGVDITAWGKLFQKKAFDKIRFPLGKIHEDDAIIPIVLYESQNVCVLSGQMYYYRKTESSIMHRSFSIKRYDSVEAADCCASYFKEKGSDELKKMALFRKKRQICEYACYAQRGGVYKSIPIKYKKNKMVVVFGLMYYCKYSLKECIAFLFPGVYRLFTSLKC